MASLLRAASVSALCLATWGRRWLRGQMFLVSGAGSTQSYGCCCAPNVRILLVTWKWSTPKLGRFKPLSCEDAPRRNLASKLLRRHRGRRIRAARTCCALDREGCNQSIEAFGIDWPPFPATWSLIPSTTDMTNAPLEVQQSPRNESSRNLQFWYLDTLAGSWQTCLILRVRNQDVNVELLQTAISATWQQCWASSPFCQVSMPGRRGGKAGAQDAGVLCTCMVLHYSGPPLRVVLWGWDQVACDSGGRPVEST